MPTSRRTNRGRIRIELVLLLVTLVLCALGLVLFVKREHRHDHEQQLHQADARERAGSTKDAARVRPPSTPEAATDPVQPPTAPETTNARVRVIDALSGDPVVGARLHLAGHDTDELAPVGVTDRHGMHSFSVPEPRWGAADLVVAHADHRVAWIPLDRARHLFAGDDSNVIEIMLRPAVVVQGRVFDSQGRPRTGVSRVALRTRTAPPALATASRFERLLADPRRLVTETDEEGNFEIRSARPSTGYTVLAAGASWAGETVMTTPAEGVARASVATETLYRIAIRFVDGEGLPARLLRGGTYLPATSFGFPSNLPGFPQSFAEQDLLSVLSDGRVAPRRRGDDRNEAEIDWAFSMGTEDEWVGPFPYTIRAPGWQPARADVWAHRLDAGDQVTEISLVPTDVRGRGAVTISWVLDDVPASLRSVLVESAPSLSPWVRVVLLPERDPGDGVSSYTCRVNRVAPGVVATLRDLPAGRYRVHVAPTISPTTVDWAVSETVDVLPDETSPVELQPSRTGSLQLVQPGGGTVFDYPAVALDFEWETPSGRVVSVSVSVYGARPVVPLLPQATYSVRVRTPDGRSSDLGPINVQAGKVATAEVNTR